MTTDETRQLGRAKNATMALLERRLSIPKIYIDAQWDGNAVDVLAIDRDGYGDVHVVLLFALRFDADDRMDVYELERSLGGLIDRLEKIPAQYKYIGAVDLSVDRRSVLFGLPHSMVDRSFAPDGLGRIGFLTIDAPTNGDPEARIQFKPERFRAKIAKLADEYVQHHEADWEIRA